MAAHGANSNNTGNVQATSTTAVEVIGKSPNKGSVDNPRQFIVKNNDVTIVIFIGFGSDVTAANGFPLAAGESLPLNLKAFDEIYAIAASGTPELRWIALNG